MRACVRACMCAYVCECVSKLGPAGTGHDRKCGRNTFAESPVDLPLIALYEGANKPCPYSVIHSVYRPEP